MAFISKGIELYCNTASGNAFGTTTDKVEGLGYLMTGLQEVGELNGISIASEREKIEITTLADDKHVYTEGILVENEADSIDFTFLYDDKLFKFFQQEAQSMAQFPLLGKDEWTVRIPIPNEDGNKFNTFKFEADIVGLKVNSASVNSALTMSLTLKPAGEITVA